MGDLEQIGDNWSQLIKEGKNISFDFVKNTDDLASILRIVSSFANTEGGSLLVGVNEKSKLTGVSPQEIITELNELFVGNHLDDIVEFHTLYISHYILVRIQIIKSSKKRKIIEDNLNTFYCRIGENSIQANKIILRYWRMKAVQVMEDCTPENMNILFALIEASSPLSLAKMYKGTSLSNKEVDQTISCLLFRKKVKISVKNEKILFQQS